jgi:UDP-N-acetylmuramate dehydrogenase
MDNVQFSEQFKDYAPKLNEPLAGYTTWKIGGPAEYFVEAADTVQLSKILEIASAANLPVTVLGWGSNVLIADAGIKGLVIRNKSQNFSVNGPCQLEHAKTRSVARLEQVDKDNYYSFSDLDYDESAAERISVTADSGITLSYLNNQLISQGVTGLQWFAGIPGTLGGAVYNNIHGGSHFMEEFVETVSAIDHSGQLHTYKQKELQFDYDLSRFHSSAETILTVDLCLFKGDKDRATKTSAAWATKKKLQPRVSAGCCFQNISKDQQLDLKLESNSWGYIIDQILHLKGKTSGDAVISPKHAAFIENTGQAKAQDVLNLFSMIYDSSEAKLGIKPKPEIVFLGFSQDQISRFF